MNGVGELHSTTLEVTMDSFFSGVQLHFTIDQKKLILIFLIKPMLNIRIEKSVKQKWPDVLKYQDRHCISSLLIRVYLDTPEPIHLERSCKPCLQTVIYEPIISHFSCGKHQQNSCSRRQIPLYAIKCNNLQSERKNSF